ncbi:hypothetical protein [Microvirga vignae]|uniref:hypothetical protein n=1 Tax=Microvirga vignae TaxID=1225564 RepID=UPI000B02D967|nr:hypothetical protein [Microvirga vignae]
MIDTQSPNDPARKADLRIRQELLDTLSVPKGAATVARRPTPEGDLLVVRLTAGWLCSPARIDTRLATPIVCRPLPG